MHHALQCAQDTSGTGELEGKIDLFRRTLERLTTQNASVDKIDRISKALAEYERQLSGLAVGTKLYKSKGFEQTPAATNALFASSPSHPYYIFQTTYSSVLPMSFDATLADGTFQFVILPERSREILVGQGGHAALANNKPVIYAGTVKFTNGLMNWWNNDTGHYQTEAGRSHQALTVLSDDITNPLFPQSKFVPFR
jgi:hypothetical protein